MKSEKINFSVLISLYNKEKSAYLEQALLSIKNQTVAAPEVVIVFDGEIDAEKENVVNNFVQSLNIKIIKLEKNLG